MRLTRSPAKRLFLVLAASLLATSAQARMEALDDAELSNVTGQAFINLTTDANAGINYTRINLGVDLDTQLNMKKLQLGQYNDSVTRPGEVAGSSDILINNFALGTVNADNSINPFRISNPFLELAYSGNKVVGVRIGFGEAKGVLSGDIQSLTGNIPVHIKGTGQAIYDKSNFIQQSALFLAGVYTSSVVEADANLVTSGGSLDPVRGTMAGIKNGDGLNCTSGCAGGWTDVLLGAFASNNCSILGIQTCFNLSQFQSLPVGNTSNMTNMEGAAKGFFISLQTQDVAWRDMDSNAFMTALKGAFMNMPKYRDANGNLVSPINIDFNQAFNGIPRQDTCLGSATKGC
ncbi:hypothetical protein thsps21_34520 [Pseudomonas sp. No.21]|uniref:DUF6160 family protein n=1 Tax=Pseudomonas tohonis TaxID=2725477 RepID=UPI001F33899A|nr:MULTISPECIES: DUF6160 family protein [Pseudomonas]MDW3716428.1 hypothetical protein [Pseudomonas sp. 2023EL-01195]GJN48306.1 hypothetical protein TUM20249_42920 [Pseudomonas tohonis]